MAEHFLAEEYEVHEEEEEGQVDLEEEEEEKVGGRVERRGGADYCS